MIAEFKEEFNKFSSKAKIHEEVIMRYDEILSEKASKWSLAQLDEFIQRNYAKSSLTE